MEYSKNLDMLCFVSNTCHNSIVLLLFLEIKLTSFDEIDARPFAYFLPTLHLLWVKSDKSFLKYKRIKENMFTHP